MAKLAGLALVLLSLALTACLGHRLAAKLAPPSDDLSLAFFPCLMLATSFEFVYFPLGGMETGLLATILLLMAIISLDRPRSMVLPCLGAFAFLVHPEAVIVYPLCVALGRMRSKENSCAASATVPGNQLPSLLMFVALLGGISAVRFAYFGDVVPNTFHCKPSSVDLVIQNARAFLDRSEHERRVSDYRLACHPGPLGWLSATAAIGGGPGRHVGGHLCDGPRVCHL